MSERLGLMTAILSMGGLFDIPRPTYTGTPRMTSYSDPKRMGQFEKKHAKSKRRKELAKASRKRNRRK